MNFGQKKGIFSPTGYAVLCQIPNWGLFITESNMLTSNNVTEKNKKYIN